MKETVSCRNTSMDLLRTLCAFSVVLLHAAANNMVETEIFTKTWTLGCFLDALTRFSIPVFMMISGKFMLGKKRSIGDIQKKILKFLIIFTFWSALYALYTNDKNQIPFQLIDFMKTVITGPIHFWYLYSLMALYLVTPLLQIFSEQAEKKTYQYILLLCFLFGSVFTVLVQFPEFTTFQTVFYKMNMDVVMGFTGCYLFGRYLDRFPLSTVGEVSAYLLGLMGSTVTFTGTLWLTKAGAPDPWILFSFFSPSVLLTAGAVFILFQKRISRLSFGTFGNRLIQKLSSLTFGTYLLHILLLDIWDHGIMPITLEAGIIFTACLVITFLIQLIPGIRFLIKQ